MGRYIALVAVVVGLFTIFTGPASADSIRSFRVKDAGSRIHFGVSVCTSARHTVRFVTYLRPEDGWPTYKGYGTDADPPGCWRHMLGDADRYAEGFWFGRIKVVVGGRIFTTRWRQFYIR